MSYKQQLIELAIKSEALKFGEFTLKSGRISPYFFNLGLFSSASALKLLSEAYAGTIANASEIGDFDVIFGPAYKGIPLAALTAVKLCELDEKYMDLGFAYDRKEKKDHGEGGQTVGSSLKGKRVLIIDDVMTAGTAIGVAYDLIKSHGGEVVAIVTSVDRQERAPDSQDSTTVTVSRKYGVPVVSIFNVDDIVEFGQLTAHEKELVKQYRLKYAPA